MYLRNSSASSGAAALPEGRIASVWRMETVFATSDLLTVHQLQPRTLDRPQRIAERGGPVGEIAFALAMDLRLARVVALGGLDCLDEHRRGGCPIGIASHEETPLPSRVPDQRVHELDAGFARDAAVTVVLCVVRAGLDADACVGELRVDRLVGAVVAVAGGVGADEDLRGVRRGAPVAVQIVQPPALAHRLEELGDVCLGGAFRVAFADRDPHAANLVSLVGDDVLIADVGAEEDRDVLRGAGGGAGG